MFEPSCDDRDHVVLLQKVDKMILAAEGEEVDKGLRTRMYAIRNLLVIHSNKTKDISDQLKETVAAHKRKILIGGVCATLAITIPYFVIARTHWLKGTPLACKSFPTKSPHFPGEVEVCINGVTRPYTPRNGDMELDITLMKSHSLCQQIDVTFWVADQLGGRPVDYEGEYNIQRIRTYNHMGLLVKDHIAEISSWEEPLVPEDVRLPLWRWVHDQKSQLFVAQPPLGEAISNWAAGFWPMLASLGSIAVTAYRFFKAGSGT